MSNFKLFLTIFILFILISTIFPEDNKPEEIKEDIKSLKDERLETIQYGIDTQVIDLLKILETEKNYEFNSDLLELLKSSTNSR